MLRALGVRIVWTVHELNHHENPHPRWDRFFNRLVARIAHRGITHCHDAARQIADAFSPIDLPMTVLPLPNYLPAYPSPPSRRGARQRLGLADSDFVFLHLGLIRPYKGTLELIQAFKSLDTNARLLVVGSVPDESYGRLLRDEVNGADRITLVDRYITDQELPDYIGAADVAVLPFLKVVNSSSVVLAMTYGLPVVASRMGCVPEALREDGGFMYEPDDPEGLRRALVAALDAGPELRVMGERNRGRAATDSWEDSARRTLEVYRLARGR
jgi:beta-1,4-mannosyltransferase